MDFIKLNNQKIKAAEVDFNFVALLSECNIKVNEIAKKQIPAVRAYVAYCMGVDVEMAGDMINQHIINGGDLLSITNVFQKKCEESDFFRALNESAAENMAESEESKVTTISKKKKTSEVEG